MAPAFQDLSFSDLIHRTPFRPSLRFADTIDRPPLLCKVSSNHIPKVHFHSRSSASPSLNSFPIPRPHIFGAQSRSTCFRCGRGGHYAKFCRNSIRCYRCGDLGHKRSKCPSAERGKLCFPSFSEKRRELEDFSLMIQPRQALDSSGRVDSMLLDPVVAGFCVKESVELVNSTPSDIEEQHMKFLETPDKKGYPTSLGRTDSTTICRDIQTGGREANPEVLSGFNSGINSICPQSPFSPVPLVVDYTASSSSDNAILEIGRPVSLDLSLVPFNIISDIVVYDEFLDYHSDEDKISCNPNLHHIDAHSPLQDNLSKGKEIWAYMDQQKFVFYCCFQAVDDFARLERAQAHGSNKLSPFKPVAEKNKAENNKRL